MEETTNNVKTFVVRNAIYLVGVFIGLVIAWTNIQNDISSLEQQQAVTHQIAKEASDTNKVQDVLTARLETKIDLILAEVKK